MEKANGASFEQYAWAWFSENNQKPQKDVFESPDAAIKEMQSRLGKDFDIERLAELGFYLCRVKVRIEVVSVLR